MEGNGTGVDIGGDGVQPVWKGGGHAGGGGGAFQIPGATPGPKRQQLASNTPEHQEGAESLGTTGKYDAEIGGGYPGVGKFL